MQMYIRMHVYFHVCLCVQYMQMYYVYVYVYTYVCMYVCVCVYIQYNSLSNSPVSTWVSIYILLVDTRTPHTVPSSCTPCQPVLVVSTSGVPFKVLSKLDYICSPVHINVCTYVRMYVCMSVFKVHTYNTYVCVP